MAPPAPQRRSGAAAATRARLFAAGRAAFADKGLAGTNLKEDILRPAEVSVGSFYHQFKDKTELLLAILKEHADSFRERLRDVHTPRPGRSLEEVARASYGIVFDLADESIDIMRIQIRERDSGDARVRSFLHEDRGRWIASLARDYERLAERTDVKADWHLAATLIVGLALSAVAHYHEVARDAGPERRSQVRHELLDGLVRFTLAGVPGLIQDGPLDPGPAH